MSLVDVARSIQAFLESNEPQVIALSGKWGRGKTHYWKKSVRKSCDSSQVAWNKYSYVSLFGLSSLSELKEAIFENALPPDLIIEGVSTNSLLQNTLDVHSEEEGTGEINQNIKWRDKIRGLCIQAEGQGRKHSKLIQSVPAISKFGPLFKTATFLTVKKYLICIDDLERRSSSLTVKDVLGLISMLREERDCNVIVIMNDDALDEEGKKGYDEYREKVFDYEISFIPEATECSRLIFSDDDTFSHVKELAESLNITNIRILNRIKRVVESFMPLVADLHSAILKQIQHSAVLLTWCYNSKEKGVPDYNFVAKSTYESMFFDFAERDEIPEEQHHWQAQLKRYKYGVTDELDAHICHYLENGFIQEFELQKTLSEFQNIHERSDLLKLVTNAWDIFHTNFENNEDEFIEALRKAFIDASHHITLENAGGAISVLRELDKNELADQLMLHWIEVQRAHNPAKLDISECHFVDKVRDQKFMDAVASAYEEITEVPTLESTIRKLFERSGWGRSDEQVLQDASEDEFYQLFKRIKGDDLTYCIRKCMQMGKINHATDEGNSIGIKVKSALHRIGNESVLNRLRVRKYGIKISGNE